MTASSSDPPHFRPPSIRDASVRAAALLAFTLLLTACPSPNTYGTARALDPGEYRVLIAAEAFQTDDDGHVTRAATPGIRVGMAPGVDIGLRLPSLSAFSLDTKIELARGELGVALDPSLAVAPLPEGGNASFAHMPVMVSYFIEDRFSMTLVPGIGYGHVSRGKPRAGDWDFSGVAEEVLTGPLARLGVGLQVRITDRTSLGPEVTALMPLAGEQKMRFFGGLGVHL